MLLHLVDTQRDFLTQHRASAGPSTGPDADPVSTTFDGFFGPTTVGEAFVTFYAWDMVVHRWDLARATGLDAALTDAELDLVERGADGFGPALHMDGICAAALEVADDAARQTRVLGRLGRRA